MPRANAQPVRLSSDVLDATKQACTLSGRSLPMEIEHRLKASLQRGAWAEVEQQLASNARAFGRLAAFLANELGSYSEPGEEAQELKAALNHLIDRMYGKAKPGFPDDQAGMVAEYWWMRTNNAQERTHEQGATMPMTPEQRALAEIQADLATGRTVPAERPEEAMAGGKSVEEEARTRPQKKRAAA